MPTTVASNSCLVRGSSVSTSISRSSSGTAQHISAWPRSRMAAVRVAGWYGPWSKVPFSTVHTHRPQPPLRQSYCRGSSARRPASKMVSPRRADTWRASGCTVMFSVRAAAPLRRHTSQGCTNSSPDTPSTSAQVHAGPQACTSGYRPSSSQSSLSAAGTTSMCAGPPWLTTGSTSASTTSITPAAMAMGLGGCMAALGTRCTCTHIKSSVTNGTPMWMNTSSENRRSLTVLS